MELKNENLKPFQLLVPAIELTSLSSKRKIFTTITLKWQYNFLHMRESGLAL